MSIEIKKIAVFVSGGGTNLQALIDAQKENFFQSELCLVLSNREDAYGLVRARENHIPAFTMKEEEEILQLLREHEIDLIVLAGYLKILGKKLLKTYENRIINIHPSLLPKHGGKGMYGLRVHQDVFACGEIESGATVHFVNEEVDGGKILLQEKIDITDCKTPEEIQQKVLKIEHDILKRAIKKLEEE